MDAIKRNLIRGAIKTFGPETIVNAINGLKEMAEVHKSTIPLQDNETDIIGIVYLKNNALMFAETVIIEDKETGNVTHSRYLNVIPVNEFVFKILEQI